MERNNQRLVIGLASALGLALLAIAFLLGRVSSTPAVVTVAAPPAGVVVAPSESVSPPPASVAATPETSNAPLPVAEPTSAWTPGREFAAAAAPPTTAGAATPVMARVPPAGDQPQIAAYFNQVDRIEDLGAGDPQGFATSMVQSMSSGDFSGFDDLLAKARAQRQRLQSIAPPRACVEHHRLALTLSGDSVAMLERLKAALVKGDSTALLTIAAEGKTLETQANQLKAMGETIKRQAGL